MNRVAMVAGMEAAHGLGVWTPAHQGWSSYRNCRMFNLPATLTDGVPSMVASLKADPLAIWWQS